MTFKYFAYSGTKVCIQA